MKYWMIALITIIASSAFAQTEISGEVSGVWTSDNSPYIVVDSTWVAQGDTLTIEAGVTVRCDTTQSLNIFGSIRVIGTEEDSVKIFGGFGDSRIWLLGAETEHVFQYAHIQDFKYTIAVGAPDMTILVENSTIRAVNKGIYRRLWNQQSYEGINLTIDHSDIDGGSGSLDDSNVFGSLTANNTLFRNGVAQSRCRVNMFNCTLLDGLSLYSVTATMDSCVVEIYESRDALYLSAPDLTITNCTINGRIWGDILNFYIEESSFEGVISINVLNAIRILRSVLTGDTAEFQPLIIRDANEFELTESKIYGGISIIDCAGSVNSCEIFGNFGFRSKNNGFNVIKKNLVTGRISLSEANFSVANNTCLFQDNQDYSGLLWFSHLGPEFKFIDNILLGLGEDQCLFEHISGDFPDYFSYNCIWGFDSLYGNRIEEDDRQLNELNLVQDPLLVEPDSFRIELTANSPCIDAGAPDSPLDPDGTRADIGAYYYPHEPDNVNRKSIPQILDLVSVYPNPFNSNTTLNFTLKKPEYVTVSVLDIAGRHINSLINSYFPTGTHSVQWTPKYLGSGRYLIVIKMEGKNNTYPITLIR